MKCEYYQCYNKAANICIMSYDEYDCDAFEQVMYLKTISVLLCMEHTKMKKGKMCVVPFYKHMEEDIFGGQ